MATRKPVVIVTGASKGIGLAITRHLLKEFSANVVALSRTRTTELLGLSCDSLLFVACDVANETALTEAITLAEKIYHHIDGLILNAGVLGPLCRIGDGTPISAWKDNFDVNFFSLVTALKVALPSLRKSELGGKVVFVSSGAAVKGNSGWGPYSASKAAMNSLCRTLAQEEPGLVSVAIRPGMVDTNMQNMLRENPGSAVAEADHQNFVRVHAEGKLVKPEACGHVIAALALQAPRELSGQFVSWDSEECKAFRNE